MSNIYVLEPPTAGKVIVRTTAGDVEIELWSKEAPKACRNFVQLSLEGYYDGCIFHRVIKDFLVQTGDPSGEGNGGESAFGAPFPNEIHSRLKFRTRGMVAMASEENEGNRSQFFMTLGACNWLDGKNTIFGKVVGDTIFNLVRLGELEVDAHERPLYPPKIKHIDVITNPFDDILPRAEMLPASVDTKGAERIRPKLVLAAVKKKSLLSFAETGEEEEDEEDDNDETGETRGKISVDKSIAIADPDVPDRGKEEVRVWPVKRKMVSDSDDSEGNDSLDEARERTEQTLGGGGAKEKKSDKIDTAREEYRRMKQEVVAKNRALKASLTGRQEDEKRLKAEAEFVSPLEARRVKYLHKRRVADAGGREKATLEKLKMFSKSLKSSQSTGKDEGAGKDKEEEEAESSWMRAPLVFPRDVHNRDDGYVVEDPLEGKRGKHGDRIRRAR